LIIVIVGGYDSKEAIRVLRRMRRKGWTRREKKFVGFPVRVLVGAKRQRPETSLFVERLNLTIRQGSAYLGRRTICQAHWKERLEDHIELFRCYYNFVRPHCALKFGREIRTPAMQAGLTERQLTLREIFQAVIALPASRSVMVIFIYSTLSVRVTDRRIALAA